MVLQLQLDPFPTVYLRPLGVIFVYDMRVCRVNCLLNGVLFHRPMVGKLFCSHSNVLDLLVERLRTSLLVL